MMQQRKSAYCLFKREPLAMLVEEKQNPRI